jgi:hypothetical protein
MSAAPRPPALTEVAARLRLLGHLKRDARRRGVAVRRVIEERVRTERQAPLGAPVQGLLGEYIRREFLPVKEPD